VQAVRAVASQQKDLPTEFEALKAITITSPR